MKRIASFLLGICLSVPASAQFWKPILKPLKIKKPVTGAVEQLLPRVQQQMGRQAMLSTLQIRRMVMAGQISERIVPSILAVPEASQLVRNELLLLSVNKNIQILPEHALGASQLLRRNVLARTSRLAALPEIFVSPLDPTSDGARLGLEALGDVYGLGWYGTPEDSAAILKLYQTLSAGDLEPLAFTAAARSLFVLNDVSRLETLLVWAQRTDAYEGFVQFLQEKNAPVRLPERSDEVTQSHVKPFFDVMGQVSKPGLDLFDFSPKASMQYQVNAARLRMSLRRGGSITQEGSLPQNEAALPTADLQNITLDLSTPSLMLGETELPSQPDASLVATFEENIRPNPITKRYPSGLQDEEQVIKDWMEYYRKGYFSPRDQIEAIRGMSARKANNLMEYFYYMSLEDAERAILDPIRQTGRLPDFMYDDKLIAGTRRLPAGYYKNKFNENIKRFVELAEEDGSIFLHNVELKEMATALEDYTFEQGFAYANSPALSAGLRRNWRALVEEIERPGLHANRNLINELWRKPVDLGDGKTVSLAEYFTQTRRSAFFEKGSTPEFYLNSPKWVAWENERRDLAAEEYINRFGQQKRSWWDSVQDFFVLGRRDRYLTLEQFGNVMVDEWSKSFATPGSGESTMLADAGSDPSCLTIKVNNFDKVGGVCQMSFSDGGYAGPVRAGYDGTSTVNRFEPVEFTNVPVVAFDFETMAPRVMTLATVPYVKDLKKPDLDQLRAGTMVGDGLDMTRDLLSVGRADEALRYIPHLKATIYPRARLAGRENLPAFLDGGGLGAYLALFTPDFFPLKKINRWRWIGGKLVLVPEYFVRKEIPTLAGAIHRNHITFTGQIEDRVVEGEK